MESITFEEIREDTLYIALELVNSNLAYNVLEHNKETRTLEELKEELLNDQTKSMFIKLDETYIGLIDYLMKNPKDNFPWIGLFLIHSDYQGYGFGSGAYFRFENEILKPETKIVRIGILKENKIAKGFWESQGYQYDQTIVTEQDKVVFCYQKSLV
ncbi:GNAT family N-acetyltransferase [Anaerobacillus sp. CMMVII]|uniref:GNAT family N-acetyltransferase n=1 Tax=Anaerobacillus sp. CMMVII TaxID=2755588 RepID=UPI0021B75C27|nr:GNAT family N-acetyltransferase [Anaerobacillus sp. CMMVII]MCT8138182.1 GNAT family N-acetyltransferase [Anaerobacillus sp. CMMVII]